MSQVTAVKPPFLKKGVYSNSTISESGMLNRDFLTASTAIGDRHALWACQQQQDVGLAFIRFFGERCEHTSYDTRQLCIPKPTIILLLRRRVPDLPDKQTSMLEETQSVHVMHTRVYLSSLTSSRTPMSMGVKRFAMPFACAITACLSQSL